MKTVVFDLDGTLADTSGDLLAAANATFAALGHAPPLGAADSAAALRGGRAMLRAGFARLGIGVDEAEIARHYPALLRHYEDAISIHTQLYPGAIAAIEALQRAGYATTICTNKPTYLAEALLGALGIRPLFSALIGAGSLPEVKPHPAPYLAAAAGSAASLLIGDTETDFLTARAAGVPVALVTFGPEPGAITHLAPDAWLDAFAALPSLAARLLGPA